MRTVFSVFAAAMLMSAPALAQDAAATATPLTIKAGQFVTTTDGFKLGRIDKVQFSGGQPVSVSLIFNQRFVSIPAATLSAADKGLITSLSRKDVTQLR